VGAALALAMTVVLTALAGWLPAYLPGAAGSPSSAPLTAADVILLLPSAYLGALVISIISAASSGGGRELLPRDQAVAYPVSPTTDHLGALLMAPLNIAWLLQAWTVLGATAFALGPENLPAAQLPVLLWILLATAVAQLVAWLEEWLRRVPAGVWVVRTTVAALVLGMAALVVTDTVVTVLDASPTLEVLLAALHGTNGEWGPWAGAVGLLLLGLLAAVVAGAWAAHVLARRAPLDELLAEGSVHAPREAPTSDLVALLRTDRAGIWRSVPLRRGVAVLALLPGLVALAGALDWRMLTILPGLVASGGALLFGVNAWCLDGRGTLWRESLPVPPRLGFATRALVLLEVLLLAVGLALVLGALRAGVPTGPQLVAVLCAAVVVTLQVVSGSLRWSVRRPFAADLRSARATPAPPLTMVGYSSRLALVTTVTGMLFMGTSQASAWQLSVILAVPFLLVSLLRLLRTADLWERPEARARVVTTVVG
jgi:hypothetical protein